MMRTKDRPKVVIAGAGFGGLSALKTLSNSPADVLIIDRNNYHTFQALLYQVASAELEPEAISFPLRSIIRKMHNVQFKMAEVTSVNLASRTILTADGQVSYDFLIMAMGSTSCFFDVPGAAENAFQLKTLDDAVTLRNHILCCLEKAVSEPDVDYRRQLLQFVVIGGGPTGVELAGALAEFFQGPVAKDYPMLDKQEMSILLLEATDNLLPGLPDKLRNYTVGRLRKMGVKVSLLSATDRITSEGIHLKDGRDIITATVVWTAGVRGHPVAEASGLPVNMRGRIPVLPTLQVAGHPEVFVIGDLACFEEKGQPLSSVAPVAIQEGATSAQNIKRLIAGLDVLPFRYRFKGSMATIGRMAAVAYIGGRSFTGMVAWFLWLIVHIYRIIGFRNRILVMVNWAWDFLFYERAVRLILPSETCSIQKKKQSRQAKKPEDKTP